MTSETKRHPFLDDLTDDVTLVASVLRHEVSGKENVLKVVKAGAAQYRSQTPTSLKDINDRRYFEYVVELDGGLRADGLVSIVRNAEGGVTHLHIAFSPLDAVLSIAAGVKETLSADFDEDIFL